MFVILTYICRVKIFTFCIFTSWQEREENRGICVGWRWLTSLKSQIVWMSVLSSVLQAPDGYPTFHYMLETTYLVQNPTKWTFNTHFLGLEWWKHWRCAVSAQELESSFFLSFCLIKQFWWVTRKQRQVKMQAMDSIDISFLTDSERELILRVLHRDEELRQLEEQRVKWVLNFHYSVFCMRLLFLDPSPCTSLGLY